MKNISKIGFIVFFVLTIGVTLTFAEGISVSQDLPDNPVMSTGPLGEQATSAKTLSLTAAEVDKIKAGNYTAAISFHYSGNDWSNAQARALQETFEKMGIEVLAITDAQFKPEKQVSDIETIMALNPDIIVSIPVDPTATAPAYKRAAEAGIKIVFMDNVPANMKPGIDYVSVVSADNYGNGVVSAEIMGEVLNGKGKIGMIFHDADYFVTRQRAQGFEDTIKKEFPNIEIVTRGGFVDPNDSAGVASAMITRYPYLDGIWVNWDVPAESTISILRSSGINDIVITTCDLGENVAINMAQGGMVKGIGAQIPYWQGVAEAIIAGYSLLGKDAAPYYAVPALKVTRDNLLEAWKIAYNTEPPETITRYFK